MAELTSDVADTICRTVELGVTITCAAVDAQDRTRLWCQVLGRTLAARVAGLLGNCVITPTGS